MSVWSMRELICGLFYSQFLYLLCREEEGFKREEIYGEDGKDRQMWEKCFYQHL